MKNRRSHDAMSPIVLNKNDSLNGERRSAICQATFSLQNVREAVAHTEITSSRK